MNYRIVFKNIGFVLRFEGGFLLLPLLVSLLYEEGTWPVWILCAAAVFVCGTLLGRLQPKRQGLSVRDGSIIVALSWIILSAAGAVPFVLTGDIPSFPDAFFETVSGFTTTGASILTDVEALHHSCLFWRSFTHWIGGMGVIVFILVFLPLTGSSSIHLLQAESPGYSVERIVPKLKDTARGLYLIYIGLTVAEILALAASRMPLFDNLCITFGTVGTGGFGVLNSSAGDYTPLQQNIITLFMILSALNFAVYFAMFRRKPKEILANEEVRWYLVILAAASAAIYCSLVTEAPDMEEGYALHHTLFQAASIMTTTGFGTLDFSQWPELARAVLVLLMFIGACAGSTGGGLKVSRLLIMIKDAHMKILHIYHPHVMYKIRMNGRSLPDEVVQNALAFVSFYVILIAASVVLISVDGFDFTTNFTAVAASVNNIGPGLNEVGPAGNFSGFSTFSKMVLAADMLFGRLELFPMLMLFHPSSWRRR
ncbi:MAG: TrkH family potassium uptake protein [Eubacterium sp.]|nr:TrkH family potassium uptake protein [Eubacterium sp.]